MLRSENLKNLFNTKAEYQINIIFELNDVFPYRQMSGVCVCVCEPTLSSPTPHPTPEFQVHHNPTRTHLGCLIQTDCFNLYEGENAGKALCAPRSHRMLANIAQNKVCVKQPQCVIIPIVCAIWNQRQDM